MVYKAQDGISSEDLKRIANEQIMEKIKEPYKTIAKTIIFIFLAIIHYVPVQVAGQEVLSGRMRLTMLI